jgi:cytidine deaminase
MKKQQQVISFEEYNSIDELGKEDIMLLEKAQEVTSQAYAPYSHFHVGACALLTNGEIVTGTNQENASFPVGLCAERVLLSSISSFYPGVPIKAIAISYAPETGPSDHPVAPCGICRQTLVEYEERLKQPIRLILGGMEGKIIVVENAVSLLPFAFNSDELS